MTITRNEHKIRDADQWNATYEEGTKVRYFPVKGYFQHVETRTRSVAWMLGDHPVVLVDGVSGGVHLDHLVVVDDGIGLNDACECGANNWTISATLISCKGCGRLWGRVNGAWVFDHTSGPGATNPST